MDTSRAGPRRRLIPRNDNERSRVVAIGVRRVIFRDFYALMLAASWGRLLLTIVLGWLSLNVLFALAYLVTGNGIANARAGSFADAFFFSVETLATIGYGQMAPTSLSANIIMTAEAMMAFIVYAVATGLIFSKFSRPTSRVIFSNVAVLTPYDGKPHLMFRLANERGNRIVDANIHAAVLLNETSAEGQRMRRFHDMALVRSRVPFLQLTWTALHPIDERSPFYGLTEDVLREREAEIIVSLTGLDETLSQIIHARFSYIYDEVVFNAVFEDVIHRASDNGIEVHFHKFHDVKKFECILFKSARSLKTP